MRAALRVALLPAATVTLAGAGCLLGYYPTRLHDLLGYLNGKAASDPLVPYVVVVLRLPRLLAAWLTGAALGLAGAILQPLLGNPLAEPGVLGINAGASLLAVSVLAIRPESTPGLLSVAALAGALLAAALVVLLAGGRLAPLRLVLVGILLGTALNAVILAVLSYGKIFSIGEAFRWLGGDLANAAWPQVYPLAAIVSVLGPAACLSARSLRVHSLGDGAARSLGARITQDRLWLLLLAVGLAAGAVAVAGPVAFVGLLAPQAARAVFRGGIGAFSLTLSGLCGGLLLLAADLAGRELFSPVQIPCGLLTAILGAPVLVVLLLRRARAA